MKICHCIKISDEEMQSLLTTRDMIRQTADDDMLALDGKRRREVHGDECLSAAGIDACEQHHLGVGVAVRHELKIRAYDAERLVDNVSRLWLH